mmetsp:Transcript_135963/g.290592  ORF Transcript_135963/g.290592 Transcript_135963/m.290592 type:complete len:397 (-) Transcript_135963:108-1298(-)
MVEGTSETEEKQGGGYPLTNEGYVDAVVQSLVQQTRQRDEVGIWLRSQGEGTTLQEHVAAVFASGGVREHLARHQKVAAAIRHNAQAIHDRKVRKKERLRQAAQNAVKIQKDHPSDDAQKVQGVNALGGDGLPKPEAFASSGSALPADYVTPSDHGVGLQWTKVSSFETQEEALSFIIECQPFDYAPEGTDEPFPRFENARDALAYVLQMRPLPTQFVSMVSEFKKCMRIRKESEAYSGKRKSMVKSLLLLKTMGNKDESAPSSTRIRRPWQVESAGTIFERPSSLRDLSLAVGARYFLAVALDVEKRVLQEGFKVKQRSSIPCSATPQEALSAFARSEERAGRTVRPAGVLAVSLPPEAQIDVVSHREGGFLVRCKELPASCFTRVKRTGAEGAP